MSKLKPWIRVAMLFPNRATNTTKSSAHTIKSSQGQTQGTTSYLFSPSCQRLKVFSPCRDWNITGDIFCAQIKVWEIILATAMFSSISATLIESDRLGLDGSEKNETNFQL